MNINENKNTKVPRKIILELFNNFLNGEIIMIIKPTTLVIKNFG